MISSRVIKFTAKDSWGDAETPDYLLYKSAYGQFFLFDPDDPISMHCLACRDEFAWEWEGCDKPDYECGAEPIGNDGKHRWIGFTTGYDINIKAVESVWRTLERKMNVGLGLKWRGTVFYRSDVDGTIVLRLSRFWVQSSTHRSVFTLLLRMVVGYRLNGVTPRTINEMIDAYHHASNCSTALKRFLAGYTKPTYSRWNDKWRKWNDEYNDWDGGEDGMEDFDKPEPDNLCDSEGHWGFVSEFGERSLAEIKSKLVKP